MVFLTQGQVAELLAETPAHWRPLVATLVGSGIRWGEAAALTVADVDLDAGTLRVLKAVGRDAASRAHVKATKTRRGVRTVRIPDVVVQQLRPLVTGRAATDPLFTTARGGRRVAHNNFHQRVWKPALRRLATAGVDELGVVLRRAWEVEPRIHDLRHTYASWALQSGVPLIELQRQMGHESITTTADRYGHLAPGAGAATAAAIGSRLSAALHGIGHLRQVQGARRERSMPRRAADARTPSLSSPTSKTTASSRTTAAAGWMSDRNWYSRSGIWSALLALAPAPIRPR